MSHADTLGLHGGLPDVEAGAVSVTYDAVTHAFSASDTSGIDFPIDLNGVMPAEYFIGDNTSFTLNATVSNAGVLTGGTFTIHGDNLYGADDSTLVSSPIGGVSLTGNLTAIGFPNIATNPTKFEFTFSGATGNLMGSPTSFGPLGGIIINSVDSHFDGDFIASFTSTSLGTADVFTVAVPTPTTVSGGLVLLGALALGRRRASMA